MTSMEEYFNFWNSNTVHPIESSKNYFLERLTGFDSLDNFKLHVKEKGEVPLTIPPYIKNDSFTALCLLFKANGLKIKTESEVLVVCSS